MKTNNLIGLCVHTPTEEAFKQVCEIAMDCGFEIQSGLTLHRYGSYTCIRFAIDGGLYFASQQFYTDEGRTIFSVEDLEAIVVLDITAPKTDNISVSCERLPKASSEAPPMPTCKPSKKAPVVSDGGSSDYYEITITNKAGETLKCQMGDVIRAVVADNFNLGNILKACRRISEAMQGRGKAGTSINYDCNKIKYSSDEIAHFHGKKLDS